MFFYVVKFILLAYDSILFIIVDRKVVDKMNENTFEEDIAFLNAVQLYKISSGETVDEYFYQKYNSPGWMKDGNCIEYSAVINHKREFYKWSINSRDIVAINDNAMQLTPYPIDLVCVEMVVKGKRNKLLKSFGNEVEANKFLNRLENRFNNYIVSNPTLTDNIRVEYIPLRKNINNSIPQTSAIGNCCVKYFSPEIEREIIKVY